MSYANFLKKNLVQNTNTYFQIIHAVKLGYNKLSSYKLGYNKLSSYKLGYNKLHDIRNKILVNWFSSVCFRLFISWLWQTLVVMNRVASPKEFILTEFDCSFSLINTVEAN
jgi:hypothetical protein